MSRHPTTEDFHALEDIIEGRASVTDFRFHNNNGPPPRNVRPYVGKWFPAVGLATLQRQQLPEIVCHYQYVGKGCHRDAIKIKVDWDMTLPMPSETTQLKATVAIIRKIVPGSIDEATLEDYRFLKRCHDRGVQKAKVPKPLKVFHSHNALCERSNGVAMVLLTTCCGPEVNVLQVTAQVIQDSTLRGPYCEKLWLQYMIWSAEMIIESIEKLGGIYTDCHGGNIVPCRWPVGINEDLDFAVVDASGLLKLHHGKGGQNKARQHLKELWGMSCSKLSNRVFREELERLVANVNNETKVFSQRDDHATADAFVQCVRDVENYARRACQQVARSHQPDSSVQERVESWPPLPNATVRPPTIVDAGSSRGQPIKEMMGLRGTVPQEENGGHCVTEVNARLRQGLRVRAGCVDGHCATHNVSRCF